MPALAALQPDQAVARHGAERARVGLLPAGELRAFVQRGWCFLGGDAEQVAVAGGQQVGEGFGRGEPDFWAPGRDAVLAARDPQRAGFFPRRSWRCRRAE